MPEVFFSERWLASFYRATDSVAAMSYLATRQITHRVIELLDLRYDSSLNAVGFPIRNFSGVLCGMRARIIAPAPEQPRYHVYRTSDGRHNQFAFLGESMLDFDKPIVMTESVFDLASVLRVYPNVCAPMSAAVSRGRLKRLNRVVELVTLFDADSAGDRARKTVRAALSDAYITDVFPTDGCKDAGEMSVVQLVALLKRYVDVTDQEVKTL
jgi:DNA primase